MIWNSDDTETLVSISDDLGIAEIYDIFGNKSVSKYLNGSYAVNVSGNPVYLIEGRSIELCFEDDRGNIVENITDSTLRLRCKVATNFENSSINNAMVVIGYYSNDKLLCTETIYLADNKNGFVKECVALGCDKIKAFVWNNYTDITPLQPAVTIKKTQNGGETQ